MSELAGSWLLVGVAGLLFCITSVVLAGAHRGTRELAGLTIAAAAFFAPLDALRTSGWLYTDLLLLVGCGLLLAAVPQHGRKPASQSRSRARGAAAALSTVVLAGLLGAAYTGPTAKDFTNAAEFAISTAGVLLLVSLWRPSDKESRLALAAFVAGSLVNTVLIPWTLNGYTGRAQGLSFHPNAMAMSSVLAICFLLPAALDNNPTRMRISASALASILCAGVLATGSRAGVLALGAVVVGAAMLWGARRIAVGTLVALTLVVGASAIGAYSLVDSSSITRISGMDASAAASDAGRSSLRDDAISDALSSPVVGTGFADATKAHNVYLQYAAVAGSVGLGAAVYALYIMASEFRSRRALRPYFGAGGFLAVLAYAAYGVVSNAMWDRWLWIPLAVALSGLASGDARAGRVGDPRAVQADGQTRSAHAAPPFMSQLASRDGA